MNRYEYKGNFYYDIAWETLVVGKIYQYEDQHYLQAKQVLILEKNIEIRENDNNYVEIIMEVIEPHFNCKKGDILTHGRCEGYPPYGANQCFKDVGDDFNYYCTEEDKDRAR